MLRLANRFKGCGQQCQCETVKADLQPFWWLQLWAKGLRLTATAMCRELGTMKRAGPVVSPQPSFGSISR